MKRPRFSLRQIEHPLRLADAGTTVVDNCWQFGVFETTSCTHMEEDVWCPEHDRTQAQGDT
jgi:hypothetical protein